MSSKIDSVDNEKRLQRIKEGAFLATIAGISAFVGFGVTVANAKKADPKYFNKGTYYHFKLTFWIEEISSASLFYILWSSCVVLVATHTTYA